MAKTPYIICRNSQGTTEFLVCDYGRWSNEFPDARHYGLRTAKQLAKQHNATVFEANTYGTLNEKPIWQPK